MSFMNLIGPLRAARLMAFATYPQNGFSSFGTRYAGDSVVNWLRPEGSSVRIRMLIASGTFLPNSLAGQVAIVTNVLSGSQASKDATTCLRIVNKVTLAFFDSYLKGTRSFTAAGKY